MASFLIASFSSAVLGFFFFFTLFLANFLGDSDDC